MQIQNQRRIAGGRRTAGSTTWVRFAVLVVILTQSFDLSAHAAELRFQTVWNAVRISSASRKAASDGLKAARISWKRSGRHWFPRLFATVRSYSTDDPAQTFFGLLGERQVSSNDFLPSTLNQPGSSFFTQAGVGLDLPLYEGGADVSRHDAMKSIVDEKKFALNEVEAQEYLRTAGFYSKLLILSEQSRELSDLERSVSSLLRRYRLGARGNPVGYSGLLGLQGLRNRIQAEILENREAGLAAHDSIARMAETLPKDWSPEAIGFVRFLDQAVPLPQIRDGVSDSVKASRARAESATKAVSGQKARFLPKIGVFANENLDSGSRGTGTSYTAGAYLSWNIFSPMDYGAVREAELRSAEAIELADAQALQERVSGAEARHQEQAARQTIQLLRENVNLLSKQTEAAAKLYRNGAINALQFVEVLSRRADLVSSLSKAQQELLEARVTELRTSGFEVPNE